MSDASVEVPEELLCPICFEVPLDKVYQCQEGHTLCEKCYDKLVECPQCKVKLPKKNIIRSRIAEWMLENYRCAYRTIGCKELVDSKTRDEHQDNCLYNEAKYGNLINICEKFGVKNCTFKMNNQNVIEGLRHLRLSHNVVSKSSELFLHLTDFGKMACESKEFGLTYTCPPFILIGEDENGWSDAIIKIIFTNEHDGTFSLSFTPTTFPYPQLPIDDQRMVEFSILNSEVEGVHELSGIIIPSNEIKNELNKHFVLRFNESKIPSNLTAKIGFRGAKMERVAVEAKSSLTLTLSDFASTSNAVAQAKALCEFKLLQMKSEMNLQVKALQHGIKANEFLADLAGKTYKMLTDGSSARNEYNKYLKKLGLYKSKGDRVKRAEQISWKRDNGKWMQSTETMYAWDDSDSDSDTTDTEKVIISFQLGEEICHNMPDKRLSKSTIVFEGNKLIHHLKIANLPQATISREFNESNNFMTATFSCDGVVAKRSYKKIYQ